MSRVSLARRAALTLALFAAGWTIVVWPRVIRPGQEAWDFRINREGAAALLDGRPLYEHSLDARFSTFIGPPTTALLYAPFARAPVERAESAYRMLVSVVLVAAVFVTGFALPVASRARG